MQFLFHLRHSLQVDDDGFLAHTIHRYSSSREWISPQFTFTLSMETSKVFESFAPLSEKTGPGAACSEQDDVQSRNPVVDTSEFAYKVIIIY